MKPEYTDYQRGFDAGCLHERNQRYYLRKELCDIFGIDHERMFDEDVLDDVKAFISNLKNENNSRNTNV